MATKIGRMVEHHALTLPCVYMTMMLPPIGHVTDIYGFVPSTRHIAIKLGRMVHQDVLTIHCI